MSNKGKVAVALSGGLDSSVTCFLLKNQGYDVCAITVKMVDDAKFEQIANNAKKVADKIGIPHYVMDLSKEFKKDVIDYLKSLIKKAKLPILAYCGNRTIKWAGCLTLRW